MDRPIFSTKPDVSKRGLLLITGILWVFASYILINRGLEYILENSHHILFHFSIGIFIGILFYGIFFLKLPKKYIHLILKLNSENPGIFSFFFSYIKGYFLIIFFIILCVYLKKNESIQPVHLSITYICIGVSLFLSSLKIFYSIFIYKKLVNTPYFSDRQS